MLDLDMTATAAPAASLCSACGVIGAVGDRAAAAGVPLSEKVAAERRDETQG